MVEVFGGDFILVSVSEGRLAHSFIRKSAKEPNKMTQITKKEMNGTLGVHLYLLHKIPEKRGTEYML